MKISVVMPCYNSKETILDSVNSVISQTYHDIELLVVDDGSSDGTVDIVKSINDNRVKVFTQSNMGPGRARNVGIDNATGDYVIFCDSDDRLDKEIIRKIVEITDVYKYDVILYRTQVINPDGTVIFDSPMQSFVFSEEEKEILVDSIFNKFLKYNRLLGFDGVCGKFIRRDFLVSNNIYFPDSILRYEDAYFCKKLYQKAAQIKYVDFLGYYYVQNSNSLCHKYNPHAVEMVRNALLVLFDGETNNNSYIKTLTSITDCEVLCLFNLQHKKKYSDLVQEYRDMIHTEPFYSAVNKVQLDTIPFHYQLEVFLLRGDLLLPYITMKKMYLQHKKLI